MSTQDEGGLGGASGRGIVKPGWSRRRAQASAHPQSPARPADRTAGRDRPEPGLQPARGHERRQGHPSASKINLDALAATIKAHEHEELAERVAELEQRFADSGRGRP